MTSSKRCPTCVGSGEIMGGGFMMRECPQCDGDGKIYDAPTPKPKVELDRRSKSYKESIAKIMESEGCDREKAVEMFDEEYEKLE